MNLAFCSLAAAGFAVALSACAASPESIQAANYDLGPYAHLNCRQLADYNAMLNDRLAQASADEESARTEDAIGLLTVGMNFGSASHKWTAWQVSDLKGRIAAVQRVEIGNVCPRQRVAAGGP